MDDKIILGWNALMNIAYSKAYAATGNDIIKQLLNKNMQFLLVQLIMHENGLLNHTWKNEKAKYPAFLDDYAFDCSLDRVGSDNR